MYITDKMYLLQLTMSYFAVVNFCELTFCKSLLFIIYITDILTFSPAK